MECGCVCAYGGNLYRLVCLIAAWRTRLWLPCRSGCRDRRLSREPRNPDIRSGTFQYCLAPHKRVRGQAEQVRQPDSSRRCHDDRGFSEIRRQRRRPGAMRDKTVRANKEDTEIHQLETTETVRLIRREPQLAGTQWPWQDCGDSF